MRIAHPHRALVAVLHLAVLFIAASCSLLNNSSFSTSTEHPIRHKWSPHMTIYQKQNYLREYVSEEKRRKNTNTDQGVKCCPSIMEMVEPEGAINIDHLYVKLYADGNYKQRFYEISCVPDILDKQCLFMDRKLHNQSRCVQEYSYTYALVVDNRSLNGSSSPRQGPPTGSSGPDQPRWSLDYIRVRSGCSCTLFAKPKGHQSKRLDKQEGPRNKKRNHKKHKNDSEMLLIT